MRILDLYRYLLRGGKYRVINGMLYCYSSYGDISTSFFNGTLNDYVVERE